MDFKQNDQVLVRKRLQNKTNLIRMGSIVRVDGDKALVQFPIDHTQAVLPLSALEKTSQHFGSYAKVQASSVRRAIYPARRRA